VSEIKSGEASAAQKLLPLVYDELHKLAAAKIAREKPGQTLTATALVHEALLVGSGPRRQAPTSILLEITERNVRPVAGGSPIRRENDSQPPRAAR
jgi:hypothetical protein